MFKEFGNQIGSALFFPDEMKIPSVVAGLANFGTRALLISNWPVETTSAKILTTGPVQTPGRRPDPHPGPGPEASQVGAHRRAGITGPGLGQGGVLLRPSALLGALQP